MEKTKQEQLQDKAIDLKGKKYILVADRVLYFNEAYPNGSINTELLSEVDADMVVVKATVIPDCKNPERRFTDLSQARWGEGFVNKTSAIENASTSAVGRCLAYMGIGIIDSIASADEVQKAYNTKPINSMYEIKLELAVKKLEQEAEGLDLDELKNRLDHAKKLTKDYKELNDRIIKLYELLPD